MAEPITAFATRRFTIAPDIGFPTGLGLRATAAPIPQLSLELHASSILLFQTYGADVTYRPLAGAFNVSPFIRVGASAIQNNLAPAFGGPKWFPMVDAQVGVEVRTNGGFSLSFGLGGVAASGASTKTTVIPAGNLAIGYAF